MGTLFELFERNGHGRRRMMSAEDLEELHEQLGVKIGEADEDELLDVGVLVDE